jgi:hypothetical protein
LPKFTERGLKLRILLLFFSSRAAHVEEHSCLPSQIVKGIFVAVDELLNLCEFLLLSLSLLFLVLLSAAFL